MQKLDDSASATAFRQGLEVLRHFKTQMSVLGDAKTLQLLGEMGSDPFTNSDARAVLKLKRQASWKRLAQLNESGLIQKRGHSYKVPSSTRDLVAALSSTLAALVTGKPPVAVNSASKESLAAAIEGLESLYAKGRLSQEQYAGHKRLFEEMIENVR